MTPRTTPNRLAGLFLLFACCSALAPSAAAQRARRPPVVPEVRFASGGAALGIPFELHDNHIYLPVSVNGSGPSLFILDTGASSLISRRHADSLGLKVGRGERGYGVGERAVEAASVEGVSLSLPGVTLSRQRLASLPLDELRALLGREVEGILGYGFFRRLVVEVDYTARIINLYSPRTYRYRGRGQRVPLIVDEESGLVFARAQIRPPNRPPLTGLFEIDSGGGHALILNRPFVERYHLLAPERRAEAVSVGGLVGASSAVEGMVATLRLGRARLENVKTFYSLAREGMLASGEFDGNIGNDVLRRFKVVFDYSRRSMFLEPAPRS